MWILWFQACAQKFYSLMLEPHSLIEARAVKQTVTMKMLPKNHSLTENMKILSLKNTPYMAHTHLSAFLQFSVASASSLWALFLLALWLTIEWHSSMVMHEMLHIHPYCTSYQTDLLAHTYSWLLCRLMISSSLADSLSSRSPAFSLRAEARQQSYMHMHIHTHTHAPTRTRTHTYTHASMHIQTQLFRSP